MGKEKSSELTVTRRRLTFADRLEDIDGRISRAEAALERLQAERTALIAAERARMEQMQAALAQAES